MEAEEKPPVFKSWSRWYWLVIITMVIQVLLYFWITQTFA